MDIIAVLTDSIEGARAARSIEPRDPLSTSALRWEVYRALQSLLDALAMLTADLGLRKPPSYGALGRPLAERGVLTGEEAEAVAFIACIRNLLAHAYRRISVGELLEVREELLRKVEALAVLDDADPALVYRVLKEGMLVYYEDERTRRVWERRLLFRVLDAGDLMEVYLPRLMKRLR